MYIPSMVVPLIGSIHSSAVPVTTSQHSPPTPQITPQGPGSAGVGARRLAADLWTHGAETPWGESRREPAQEVSGPARAGLTTAQAAPVTASHRPIRCPAGLSSRALRPRGWWRRWSTNATPPEPVGASTSSAQRNDSGPAPKDAANQSLSQPNDLRCEDEVGEVGDEQQNGARRSAHVRRDHILQQSQDRPDVEVHGRHKDPQQRGRRPLGEHPVEKY